MDIQRSQAAAIIADSATTEDEAVTKRQHFPMNINRTGYIVFSVSYSRFINISNYCILI